MKTCKVFVSPRSAFNSLLAVFAIAIFGASLTGCGSSMQMAAGVAPSITTEPAAQSTPVGQMAIFTVVAAGSAPLGYQWSENGMAINGATSSSFTTPAVLPANTGASFTVAVTNKIGSATSSPALLTVLPRAPQTGDWRFQGMDLPAGTVGASFDLLSAQSFTLPNFIGSPLGVGLEFDFNCDGPSDCAWEFSGLNSTQGDPSSTALYTNDSFDNLETDLSNLASGSIVIRSLDLEPTNQIFAVGAIQTSPAGGFEFASQTVPPGQLQAVATQLGGQSRVITALGYDASGNVFVVSYGWQSDIKTVYETQAVVIPSVSTGVATADSDVIITTVTNLANQGYIITAMGGSAANGLVLIGTRVQGDTLARPLRVSTTAPSQQGQISSAILSLSQNVGGVTPAGSIEFAEQ
jgi:hypothetical protein